MRCKSKPSPKTACKPNILFKSRMRFDFITIIFLIYRIIIPIYQINIIRDHAANLFGYSFSSVFIAATGRLVEYTEKHITPHKQFKSIFFSNFCHTVKMFEQNIKAVNITINILISASAKHMCFIHTDIDSS